MTDTNIKFVCSFLMVFSSNTSFSYEYLSIPIESGYDIQETVSFNGKELSSYAQHRECTAGIEIILNE